MPNLKISINQLKLICFILLYSLYKIVAVHSGSEPSGKTIQSVTICHVRVACWLGAVWMGWAVWVGLAGLSRLSLLAGC